MSTPSAPSSTGPGLALPTAHVPFVQRPAAIEPQQKLIWEMVPGSSDNCGPVSVFSGMYTRLFWSRAKGSDWTKTQRDMNLSALLALHRHEKNNVALGSANQTDSTPVPMERSEVESTSSLSSGSAPTNASSGTGVEDKEEKVSISRKRKAVAALPRSRKRKAPGGPAMTKKQAPTIRRKCKAAAAAAPRSHKRKASVTRKKQAPMAMAAKAQRTRSLRSTKGNRIRTDLNSPQMLDTPTGASPLETQSVDLEPKDLEKNSSSGAHVSENKGETRAGRTESDSKSNESDEQQSDSDSDESDESDPEDGKMQAESVGERNIRVLQQARELYTKNLYSDTFKLLRTIADNGVSTSPEAQYLIGFLYFTGKGVEPSYELGLKYTRRAASLDYPHALVKYAQELLLVEGWTDGINARMEALKLLHKAHSLKFADGTRMLANLYMNGLSVNACDNHRTILSRNVKLAQEMLAKLGDRDDKQAQ